MSDIYYIYQIIFLKGDLAGKYYYGQHKLRVTGKGWQTQECLMENPYLDAYAGSGTIVKRYFNKYGKIPRETYIKTIIKFANDAHELSKFEMEVIGDLWKSDGNGVNLQSGGTDYTNRGKLRGRNVWLHATDEFRKLHSERTKAATNTPEYRIKQHLSHIGQNTWSRGRVMPDYERKNHSIAQTKVMSDPIRREKLSKIMKGRKMGPMPKDAIEKMRQTKIGKIFVCNGDGCKLIDKSSLDEYIKKGYIRGRVYNSL